jgi:hypothetical protein
VPRAVCLATVWGSVALCPPAKIPKGIARGEPQPAAARVMAREAAPFLEKKRPVVPAERFAREPAMARAHALCPGRKSAVKNPAAVAAFALPISVMGAAHAKRLLKPAFPINVAPVVLRNAKRGAKNTKIV